MMRKALCIGRRSRRWSKMARVFPLCFLVITVIILGSVSILLPQETHKTLSRQIDGERYTELIKNRQGLKKVAIVMECNSANGDDFNSNTSHINTILAVSFCKTASQNYRYAFYFVCGAIDTDGVKAGSKLKAAFNNVFLHHCNFTVEIKAVVSDLFHKGTQGVNAAVWEAYVDGAEYFYHVYNGISFTHSWRVENLVYQLKTLKPPNIGAVYTEGPNTTGLIQKLAFLHMNHVDIFGLYLPSEIPSYCAHQWITSVYTEFRVKIVSDNLEPPIPERRNDRKNCEELSDFINMVRAGKACLDRFVHHILDPSYPEVTDSSKVISMSLTGGNIAHAQNVIRSAQLLPVVLPGWRMRLYVEKRDCHRYPSVPKNILGVLLGLYVDIHEVDTCVANITPESWRHLVLNDITIDYFIIQDTTIRLSDVDLSLISSWINSEDLIFCLSDYSHSPIARIVGSFWGGKPSVSSLLSDRQWEELIRKNPEKGSRLTKYFWHVIEHESSCFNHPICHEEQKGTISEFKYCVGKKHKDTGELQLYL